MAKFSVLGCVVHPIVFLSHPLVVDPIAARVASRYLSTENDIAEPLLTPPQLADELEPTYGRLVRITIHPPGDDPTVAHWEAVTKNGEIITGTITLGSRWLDRAMIVYPVVQVHGADRTATQVPKQLLEDRLRQVVLTLKRLVSKARARPDIPAHTLAADIQKVIDLADF